MMLRDLGWLVELGELGHVTETAAALGTSQPTLSRSLARIEAELGVRVFERTPTGLEVTPTAGWCSTPPATSSHATSSCAPTWPTGSTPTPGSSGSRSSTRWPPRWCPKLLRAFHAEAPGVKVVLSQEPAHDIRSDLDRGAVELGLTMDRADDLGWLAVQRERLVVVVPPTHRFRDRTRVDLAELADDELVTTPPGFGHSALVQALLAEAGVSPRVSFESADLATIEGLVAAGLGVGDRAGGVRRSVGVGGARAVVAVGDAHDRAHVAHRPAARAAGRAVPGVRARPDVGRLTPRRGRSALARAEEQPAAAALRGCGIAGAGHHSRLG